MVDPWGEVGWKNSNCAVRRLFVCEVPASGNPTTIQPPTITPNKVCSSDTPDDGWVLFSKDQGGTDEYCYNFNTEYKNWMDAYDDCTQRGGRLPSIHSEQENTFVMDNVNSYDISSWIGFLRDSKTDQFQWVDGTDADFKQWGKGGK